MCRFLKYKPGKAANLLRSQNPFAFLLLGLIAERVKRTDELDNGLEIGEALIGDFEAIGATRGQYREALKILVKAGLITIIKAVRKQKVTTITTTITTTIKGTVVTLCNSDIWDVNILVNNHHNNHHNNHEQERVKNEAKNKKEESLAQNASLFRKREVSFSFTSKKFENIENEDIAAWTEAYPGVSIHHELLRMQQWCLANPAKARSKKRWRQFINNWLKKSHVDVINKNPQILEDEYVPKGEFDDAR